MDYLVGPLIIASILIGLCVFLIWVFRHGSRETILASWAIGLGLGISGVILLFSVLPGSVTFTLCGTLLIGGALWKTIARRYHRFKIEGEVSSITYTLANRRLVDLPDPLYRLIVSAGMPIKGADAEKAKAQAIRRWVEANFYDARQWIQKKELEEHVLRHEKKF